VTRTDHLRLANQGQGQAGSPHGEPAGRPAEACARRALVYEALALGFREPTADLAEALAGGTLVAAVRAAVAWLDTAARFDAPLDALSTAAATLSGAGPERALSDMTIEHARLFTGPGRPAVMCYASQYLDADRRGHGRLNGAAATFAAAAYGREGVVLHPDHGELPDHATVELEFLFHLCRREERAWDAGQGDEAARLRRTLGGFLHDHAGLWLPEFAAAVRAAAARPPYSGLADLLTAHLAVELGEETAVDAGRPMRQPSEGTWTA
jgi:TorA maturation chaperone TorD